MPCVRTDTGEVVPGAFGSCPIGSTWQDNAAPQISMVDAPKDDLPLQRVSIEPVSRGTQLAVGGAAALAPFVRGGFQYAKKKIGDPKNIDRLANLKNRLFKRFVEPARPKYPIMNQAQQAAWRQRNPGKWELDPMKLTSAAGIGGLTLTQLMSALGGDKEETTEKKKTEPAFMSDAQRMEQLDSSPKKVSTMEKLMKNMKNPEWWNESMSGLPHDTRMHRMAVLMDYYGRTPKGRAAVDMPAKVFAANEAAAAKIKAQEAETARKAAEDAKGDAYDWSYSNVQKVASEFFKSKFGTDWPGGKDRDEMQRKFIADLTDEKARYPQLNIQELMELLLSKYPERYL